MTPKDYIKKISKKVEYFSTSIIDLYETPLEDIYVYKKRNQFEYVTSYSKGAIICPKSFNSKFIIRNLFKMPILFSYPKFLGDKIKILLIDVVKEEFVYLTIYTKKYFSFKEAFIDIHNKNISKNFNLIEKFETSNKKFKTYQGVKNER